MGFSQDAGATVVWRLGESWKVWFPWGLFTWIFARDFRMELPTILTPLLCGALPQVLFPQELIQEGGSEAEVILFFPIGPWESCDITSTIFHWSSKPVLVWWGGNHTGCDYKEVEMRRGHHGGCLSFQETRVTFVPDSLFHRVLLIHLQNIPIHLSLSSLSCL